MSNSNSQTTTLVTEMTTSYERATLAERYRVLPFLLSTVNKILSRSTSCGLPDGSSDTSNSAATLAAIACFYSSLKGLTTVDLCMPLSTNTGVDYSSGTAHSKAYGDISDSSSFKSEKKVSLSGSSKNSDGEHQEQTDNSPFSEHLHNPAVLDGIEEFTRNQEAISRTIFLLTICMETVKVREVQNKTSHGNRSVVIHKESRSYNKGSGDKDIDSDNNDDDDDDCHDNREPMDKQKQKHSTNNNSANNNNNNNNNKSNTDHNKNSIDTQFPLKKQLNGDDDAIIYTGFEALKIAQILWTLSDNMKQKNKSLKTSTLQEIQDNQSELITTKGAEVQTKKNFKSGKTLLQPFSSIFLAQLVQFSLFFGSQRYSTLILLWSVNV